jgi:hypothetical protein
MEVLRLHQNAHRVFERGIDAIERLADELERFDILLRLKVEESRALGY